MYYLIQGYLLINGVKKMENKFYETDKEWIGLTSQQKIMRYLKFLLIPCYRAREFNQREYHLSQTKTKRKFFRRLLTPLTIFAVLLVLFSFTLAVFPQWLTRFTIEDLTKSFVVGEAYNPPSPGHPMGQTQLGWDIYGRVIWGARTSLTVGLQSLLISSIVGISLGIFAAFSGGAVDNIIMRILDMIMVFPSLILALIFVAIFGPGINNLMLAFGLLGIPGYARMIRGTALQTMTNGYIDAARASGSSKLKIMYKEILPNSFSPVIISLSFGIAGNIMALAGLAFFGFVDSSLVSWGTDINFGRAYMNTAPHVSFWPGVFIFIASLGFMLLGDGLRDALDPKLSLERGS
jgi:peptide/nickel transport system permease protein